MWREAVGRPLDDSIATVLRSPKPYSSSDSTGVGSVQPVLHMPEPCGNLARDSRTRLGMSGPEMCTSILGGRRLLSHDTSRRPHDPAVDRRCCRLLGTPRVRYCK